MMRRHSQQFERRRGSAAVEFALCAPVIIALFLGVVMFGYDFYVYNRLETVVYAGSRFASIQTYDSHTGLDPALRCTRCSIALSQSSSDFARRTANFTVYGTPDPGVGDHAAQALVENLSPANIVVTLEVKNNMPVTVSVAVTGFSMATPAGPAVLNGRPATSFPWMGRSAAAP
jgi:Flp pilus assembly protein TadG